jgi:hypothetical protein
MIIVAAQGKQFGKGFPVGSDLNSDDNPAGAWESAAIYSTIASCWSRPSPRHAAEGATPAPATFSTTPARGALQNIRQPIGIGGRGMWTTLIAERPGMRLKPSGRKRGHGGRDPQNRESHED